MEMEEIHGCLSHFIEQAPVAIAMFDRQMRYISASRRWRSDFGLEDRNLHGLSHYALFPEIGAAWKEIHRRGLRGEWIKEVEDRFERADGSVQWLHWEVQPWHESSGEVGGIIIFSEDITERKEAELAVRDNAGHPLHSLGVVEDISARKELESRLLESEEKFRILSDAMPQMVWASRRDGRAYYLNSRWLEYTGQSFEEAEGLGWLQALHPEDVPLAQDRWTEAVATGKPYEAEYRIKGKNGQYCWFLSRGIAKRGSSTEIEQWVGTCTDISAQKALEKALSSARDKAEEASRIKSEFLANISHEIRTPMTVFMAAIEQLSQKDQDPESRHLLEMAEASANRLLGLIENILDFSRLEAQRVEMEEVVFDLRPCLTKAVALFELPAREKNLRLELDVASDVPERVLGDPHRLGQIVVNLVGNAVKFTGQGEILVTVRPRGGFLEIAVADTGIGFPEGKKDLLFQSFSQADSSLTRRYGGSGLGLAISKGLVELMGGEISASNRVGGGAVFTFTVPLRIAEGKDFVQAEPVRGVPDAAIAPNILLAEDDPVIRRMVKMMLAKRGWRAEMAECGRDAVEMWEKGRFDVVLMDIQMPEVSGLEATRVIRAKEAGHSKQTRIIGLTAHAHREVSEEALEAGMDEVLIKPIRMDDLYAAIAGSKHEPVR